MTIESTIIHDAIDVDLERLLTLRDAIFAKAFEDWQNASERSKAYILETYAKLEPFERRRQYRIGKQVKAQWILCAEIYDFFNTPGFYGGEEVAPWADAYLIDLPYTGADLWEMYMTGSWNRGGILDVPYKRYEWLSADEVYPRKGKERVLKTPKISWDNDYLFPRAAERRKAWGIEDEKQNERRNSQNGKRQNNETIDRKDERG